MQLENRSRVLTFPNTRSLKSRQKFLQKVNRWLIKRYAVSIDYVESYHIDGAIFSKLAGTEYVVENGKILLAVAEKHTVSGCLVLTPGLEFKKSNMKMILELIQGIVAPFILQLDQTNRMKVEESRLQQRKASGGVLSLFSPYSDESEAEEPALLQPLYIQGNSTFEIKKQALDEHEKRDTLFFLPFDQIDIEKRVLSDELRTLGRTTIFIGDLSLLRRKDLGAVLDIIRESSAYSREQPFFILGSTVDFSIIERTLKLSAQESDLMTRSEIYLDQ